MVCTMASSLCLLFSPGVMAVYHTASTWLDVGTRRPSLSLAITWSMNQSASIPVCQWGPVSRTTCRTSWDAPPLGVLPAPSGELER
eukprot:10137807-Heterocapsa_arctica.AAC.1